MEHNANYNQKVRGYRNNNPLNLRRSQNQWKGKIPFGQSTDKSFEQFETMVYGFRAAMLNIRTQMRRTECRGLTVAELIRLWAPESDGNDTHAYTWRVCAMTGYEDNTTLLFEEEMITHIVYAMAVVENGSDPLWDDIFKAWEMVK